MIIRTRKLPATNTEGERMRATSDSGVTITIPFPFASPNPAEVVARCLARAIGWETTLKHVRDNRWELAATRRESDL